jgi:cysteine desulfurase
MEEKRLIYMDHSATTPVHPEVVAAMQPFFSARFGNPSSVYGIARSSREALEDARAQVAGAVGAKPEEIYFTAGGTESDNWAIKGAAFAGRKKGNHIVTTAIEHHAVLHTCRYLENEGFSVTYLPVDSHGLVNVSDVEKAITDKTVLISVMYANNEIGTIEPVAEIGALAREYRIPFHTDAVQAIGNVQIDVKAQGIDLLSLSAHKFCGPKGVGALYVRNGVRIDNFIHGGAQEKKRRAGTENLPGIIGLAKAIGLATADIPGHAARISALRNRLLDGIMESIPHTRLNGHPERRLPGNINVSFGFIEGEALLLLLDDEGICASTGSACSSGSPEPSHVLLATGLPAMVAHGSLRLTLGNMNTAGDVDRVLAVLPGIVQKLRDMSPLYDQKVHGRVRDV